MASVLESPPPARDWAREAQSLLACLARGVERASVDALVTVATNWLAADGAGAPALEESRERVLVARRLGERLRGGTILHLGAREGGIAAALAAAGARVWSFLDHPARAIEATLHHGGPEVQFAVRSNAVVVPAPVDLAVVETFDGVPVLPLAVAARALRPDGRLAILGEPGHPRSRVLCPDGGLAIDATLVVADRTPLASETGAALYRLDLLASDRTKLAHLEFTSHCNLRCVYCPVSQPTYEGRDLDLALLEPVIATLRRRRLDVVVVNGHGETTMVKGWHRYCRALLDAGLPLQVTTNFARELDREEADTLARFRNVEVSCDTVDRTLLRQLRRSVDLRTILLNMANVRAAAFRRGIAGPRFAWSCVVSDQTVLGLPETVRFGLAVGVRDFDFCSLTEYPHVPGTLPVRHIARLPVAERSAAYGAIQAAIDLVRAHGASCFCQPGLVADGESQPEDGGAAAPAESNVGGRRFSAPATSGSTRDCLDPWTFVMLNAQREVLPCCWHGPLATLEEGAALDALIEGEAARELRARLLSGQLDDHCRSCPSRGWTDPASLAAKVARYLATGVD